MISPHRLFPQLNADDLALTKTSPHTLERPKGRVVAYDLRGDLNGRPCFWFHGSPSCRLEGILLEQFGRTRGHKFIVLDRPGIGGSDYDPTWTMPSFVEDVLAVADSLELSHFSVAGGSGGGPFVLAMAAIASERIHHAVSLACAGAFEYPDGKAAIGWVDRWAAWAIQYPSLIENYFRTLGLVRFVPEKLVSAGGGSFSPTGQKELVILFLRVLRESLRSGPIGVVRDTCVLHEAWGFDLQAINIEVDLVSGTRDGFVPPAYGTAIAQHIPKVRHHIAEGDDHFRTIFDLNRLHKLLTRPSLRSV